MNRIDNILERVINYSVKHRTKTFLMSLPVAIAITMLLNGNPEHYWLVTALCSILIAIGIACGMPLIALIISIPFKLAAKLINHLRS